MYDNGLLKYYRERSCKGGFLRESDIPIKAISDTKARIRLGTLNSKRFYIKTTKRKDITSSYTTDSEVLLSQIYSKAGLLSAIYLPIETEMGKGVISNDVSRGQGRRFISAEDYLDFYAEPLSYDNSKYLNPYNKSAEITKYFTLKALREQTKMRILDTASFNIDRHSYNFFYGLSQVPVGSDGQIVQGAVAQGAEQASSNVKMREKADGIASIDYEYAGLNAYLKILNNPKLYELDLDYNSYINDFSVFKLPRDEMLKEFRENEPLGELVDKQALAEEIGTLDPVAVAQDVTAVTGYEFDPKYTELLAKSYDEVAEALIQ